MSNTRGTHHGDTEDARRHGEFIREYTPCLRAILRVSVVIAMALLGSACRQDMHDQPKYKPLRPADAVGSINDGMSARPLVEGTVARGMLREDTEFYTGRLAQGSQSAESDTEAAQESVITSPASTVAGAQQTFQGFVTRIPVELNREAIDRGQERFNIYCSVCHGRAGDGKGMIALRGFRRDQMPSFHQDRLRTAPPGYFFDVMTAGLGAMPSYAGSISAEDRWKIVAYIRALQLSQGAKVSDLPPELQQKLNNPTQTQGGPARGEH